MLVFAVEGPFFFGAVETIEQALASTRTDPEVLIIRLEQALETFERGATASRDRGSLIDFGRSWIENQRDALFKL